MVGNSKTIRNRFYTQRIQFFFKNNVDNFGLSGKQYCATKHCRNVPTTNQLNVKRHPTQMLVY